MNDRKPARIAITGMAGRFPGARNIHELWENLKQGKETISHFSDAELAAQEYAFEEVCNEPGYVKSRGVLDDVDMFDAEFFGFRPREAASLDPQQRLWFECAWNALEDAGISPKKFSGKIGVFAGSGYLTTYLLHNILRNRDSIEELVRLRALDAFQNIISNDKDFLPTRTSFLFGLTGPSINVQTACSTSLVAVAQAAQSLLLGESDACLAGGISIQLPQVRGYLTQDGGMESPDGHIRVFDAQANGTVFSNGAGVVVLRRLDDALADGDEVLAVLDGYGLNNDGGDKPSYIAPSVEGQADVIRQALSMAQFPAESVSYIEAHGTGTSMGDPIEIAALSEVFREGTQEKQFCRIGSIKSNLGHMDSASGIAGLIKSVLAIQHREIPPTLHYATPNPRIDFENSPFKVADRLQPWTATGKPLRAGISSFGVGGTNVHVVIEEPPQPEGKEAEKVLPWQLITLSAKSDEALEEKTAQLAAYISSAESSLSELAFTLFQARDNMSCRRFIVARDSADLLKCISPVDGQRSVTRKSAVAPRELVFMFPGQGSQHINMAKDIYETDAEFREHVDHCASILQPLMGVDIRELIFPLAGIDPLAAAEKLKGTDIAQPALFIIEYGLARLWMRWGLQPTALIGHSLGEYTAACLAEVFSLEDALRLLYMRGKLMHEQPGGDMLAVRVSAERLSELLPAGVDLAAANAPALSVASGPEAAIAELIERCESENIEMTALHTSHAFHSEMMEAVLAEFETTLRGISFAAPRIPIMSSCSGEFLTATEATSIDYWSSQLRKPVLFAKAIAGMAGEDAPLFLEVGPGNTLSSFARQCAPRDSIRVVSSCAHAKSDQPVRAQLLSAAGQLWLNDVTLDAKLLCGLSRPKKVRLPTYPFQHKSYWIDPPQLNSISSPMVNTPSPVIAASTNTMTEDTQTKTSRVPEIRNFLLEMITDLSGEDYSAEEQQLTFIELGFDSLFLTQVSTELQNKLGVKLRFRRMLEDLSTLDSLTAYFDENLPADKFAVTPEPTVNAAADVVQSSQASELVTSAASTNLPHTLEAGSVSSSGVEKLVQDQLLIMQQQLELMRGIPSHNNQVSQVLETSAVPAMPVQSTVIDESSTTAAKPRAFGAQAKIDTAYSEEMNPTQADAFARFSKRYLAKTVKSKEFTQRNRKTMSDPRVVTGFRPIWKEIVFPLVVNRSKGALLWDLDGNEYVDLTCGFGSNFLGNQPDFITEALHEQIESGYEVGPQHPLTQDVTDLIRELTGTERVAFCNTGSEAVMGAMRQARTITGRSLVAIFTNSYHGIFDEVIVRGTKKLRSIAAAPGILASAVENVLVLEYGSPESLKILRERGPELAAIMAEPVQSRNPKLQPREFLQELRVIADDCGSALIFDEVITGFRIEQGGAQAYFGVRADLVTYGKIIGGGLPFAAIAGNSKFMDALDGGYWEFGDDSYPEVGVTYFAGTFVRHPLALAAAKASLEYLKAQGPELQRNLNERTSAFARELNDFFRESQAPVNIDNFGSLCRITVAEDEQFGSLLYYFLRDRGIHIWEGFGCFLTTAHTDDQVRFIVDAFKASIRELQSSGLMSGEEKGIANKDSEVTTDRLSESPQSTVRMTDAQQEIWIASQLSPRASCAYNESFTLELQGNLDFDKFHAAVDWVNARHDALWLRFSEDGEFQHKVPVENLQLPQHDLSSLESSELEIKWQEILHRHATEPFDLEKGPLIRNEMYQLSESKFVLVSTAHHIVFDGWSAGVYIDEIGAAYTAQVKGENINLPSAPSFIDYVQTERQECASDAGETALAYWRKLYAEPVEPLNLPGDRDYPASKTFQGNSVHWKIKNSTYEAIRAASASQGSTLYSLMLAAYFAFLHRLSGRTDIVVGIPTAGQAIVGDYSLIGHCVNILPLRARPAADDSFAAFLSTTARAVLDAQDHQPATFGAILREAKIARNPSRSPLVEVIFNLNRKLPENSLTGLDSKISEVKKQAINWDLFLNCSEEDGALTIDCDYNTDILDESTVCNWLTTYERILDGIAANPAIAIGQLPLLDHDQQQQLLNLGAGATLKLPCDSLPQLLYQQAETSPERVALQQGANAITYAELRRYSSKIGSYLSSLGVKPGDGVGVCMTRSLALPVVLLGIQSAGAFYVPIDPMHPASKNKYILDDANIAILISDFEDPVEGLKKEIQVVDIQMPFSQEIESQSESIGVEVDAESTAYVIYTSGSTGKPKGVCIPHRALVNLVQSMIERPGMTADSRLLAVTTISFDIAGLEFYCPLAVGGKVVIAADDLSEDPDGLAAEIENCDINIMQATPTHWRMLLDNGWKGKSGLKVLSGGETLPVDIAEQLTNCCGEVWNMYGPTETTIWSTCHKLEKADLKGPIPIGKSIHNTDVYILDQDGNTVPIGVPGELCIGGYGLANAYMNNRQLTEEKFTRTSEREGVQGRIYHTGDLARWNSQGILECMGRLDDQVKVRGYRIELGEIETALLSHEAIRGAVVSVWEPAPGDNRLVAYVVSEDSDVTEGGGLRNYLRSLLPEYMIPQHLQLITEVPLTLNGKLDRTSLPTPQLKATPDDSTIKEQTELEGNIMKIWQEVLGIGSFSTSDDFFDLGGHSILAVKALNRMRQEIEKSLSLKEIFEYPTVERVASKVEMLQLARSVSESWDAGDDRDREELVL